MDFLAIFGRKADVTASAPGRVNLIGEHTDYNGGFVLPTAIPQRTRIALASRQDQLVRIVSTRMAADPSASPAIEAFILGEETPGRGWLDYVQGVARVLRQDGHALRGFDALVDSDVPVGGGLSSSAALDVALLRGLRQLFALPLDDVEIARLGQRVENEFVGAQVGIMDPMAASLADENVALFLDARNLEYQRVPMPAGADLIVLSSGIAHDHAAGDYNTRRRECEQAAQLLGVSLLRELNDQFVEPGIREREMQRVNALPEPLNRRVRHVVTENERVLQAVDALRRGDWPCLGRLFYDSHASMRDDYQVSIVEIDLIVELARAAALDVFGARLTGGGFGGSVVMLARVGAGRSAAEQIAGEYARRSGRQPAILCPP